MAGSWWEIKNINQKYFNIPPNIFNHGLNGLKDGTDYLITDSMD
jgi:hypothetical protein